MIGLAAILYPPRKVNMNHASKYLRGKTIVITGATFGIGEALTRTLLGIEVNLILVARTESKLMELKAAAQNTRAKVEFFACNLYEEDEVRTLCEHLRSIPIDYLISNAGKSMMRSAIDSSARLHDYQRTIKVNYLAPVQIISMLMDSFSRDRTHIVNVSTYNVLMKTPPFWSAYVSSKKAMHSWVEAIRPEFASKDITFSNIYLPLVESRMKDRNQQYRRTPAMTMESVVAVIIRSMCKKTSYFKPWWHVPFQILLFVSSPLWNWFWIQRIKRKS